MSEKEIGQGAGEGQYGLEGREGAGKEGKRNGGLAVCGRRRQEGKIREIMIDEIIDERKATWIR
eukprot:2714180-Rhodomonas_salina.1